MKKSVADESRVDGPIKSERADRSDRVPAAIEHTKEGMTSEQDANVDVSITGKVLGVDGKPAVGYRVTALCEKYAAMHGWPPTVYTDARGNYVFEDLPEGLCQVGVTSNPKMNQPNIRVWNVQLKKGKPVVVDFTLEQKYSFSGEFVDKNGVPQPNRNVLAIWEGSRDSPQATSSMKTDAMGHYVMSSPFEVAKWVTINDGNFKEDLEHKDVKHGRTDVDFQ